MNHKSPAETRFKPGQSGNPGGRPKLSDNMRRIRELTQEQIEEIGDLILMGNLEKLKAIKDDPCAPVLKVCIASVVIRILKRGDMAALNALLDRMVGKIPSRVEADLEYKFEIVKRIESASEENILRNLPEAIRLLQSGDGNESV